MRRNRYAVVLAGGSGTRFWPLSRRSLPKQFLRIVGGDTFFEQTIRRIIAVVPPKNVFVVTNSSYQDQVMKLSAAFKISPGNILCEPCGRNTAPAIAWAASRIQAENPEGVMAVLPSDHYIGATSAFLDVVDKAFHAADQGRLVTLGIRPDRPETGYGYMKVAKGRKVNKLFFEISEFKEKPNLVAAKKYFRSGRYYWNSGMFFWRADVILRELGLYLPKVQVFFQRSLNKKAFTQGWSDLPDISIDYGVLQKARGVVMVPAERIGWNDIGSWISLKNVLSRKPKDSIHRGKIMTIGTGNNLIWADQRLIAAVGVNDLIIVDTPDALLICHQDRCQDVKEIVQKLRKREASLT